MAQTTLSIRVDENIKEEVEILSAKLGLTLSAVTNVFYRQFIKTQGIPFPVMAAEESKRRHIPLKERLRNYDYNNGYKTEEWDTGEPVGREVF